MIIGVGIDQLDIARVERELAGTTGFREQVFTEVEVAYCEAKAHPAMHYAARFAAKEAFMKGLGTGWRDGIGFGEIEIRNDSMGRPALQLRGRAQEMAQDRGVTAIHVSLTHTRTFAAAVVLLEG
ncbi:MAG: holo-ACP synthase [Candidatus Zixiibacteriota bacterium]